jgi:hypothetical protein
MSAGHDHHHHTPASYNAAFAIGIGLNIAFVAIEAFYGWKVDSLALLADAGHNLSDVIGLVLAWGGVLAGKLRPMRAIPTAGSAPASWRPSSTRCCCWWPWARWPGRRCTGCSRRRPSRA